MPQFHETLYGRRFLESQLPRLIKQLEIIGSELKRMNDNQLIPNNERTRFEDELALADFIKIQVLNELLNDN
ncbi:hypothetical protein QE429_000848 [Bacillus sp. SORGH_AS 510]|uniref:hypothetical protein n=1 Tax=Bacillus sp. SORGH_AS_0510 TaxID=3041771 RepID=UPI0027874B49|nr:hypothetical protein [Bacillus sp. SORGH_AS_0510]MDQ1144021.1 hypothetical protein [Bacillus sp. SORGH_AS_0510]